MKVRNKASIDVEIARDGAPWVFCAAGGTVEVDDELGGSLCEQVDKWERVADAPKSGKAAKEG